jgi:hypothetical protein
MPSWGGLAGGFSLLGDRQIRVAGGDGPEIQVKVYGLFSEVKVTDQPGSPENLRLPRCRPRRRCRLAVEVCCTGG